MPHLANLRRLPLQLALVGLLLPRSLVAQAPASQPAIAAPSFEVASIKPSKPEAMGHDWDDDENRISIRNYTLRDLIKNCYHLHTNSQIINAPDWIAHQHFDIDAKIDDDELARMNKMNHADENREYDLLLQSFLADRFHLKLHQETRLLPAYALRLDGPIGKLKPTPQADPSKPSDSHSMNVHNSHLEAKGISMEHLAATLAGLRDLEDRVVVDRTSLPGEFDFTLDWTADHGPAASSDAAFPGLFTALREQLGLKLEHETDAVPVVVIEAATPPELD